MREITVTIEPDLEAGGYVAFWRNLESPGGLTTQGDTLPHLHAMIKEAVALYFEDRDDKPKRVRLHFEQDPKLALA